MATRATELRAVRHILQEARSAYNLNSLSKLRAGADRRLAPAGYRPARRNRGKQERLDAAAAAFAADADAAIRDYLVRDIGPEQLRPRVRAAYVRHGVQAFLAGKQALGNLDPLTIEDQAAVARAVEREGLTRGMPVTKGSLGALLDRITSQPPLPPKERATLDHIDGLLDDYLALLIRRAMAPALPAGEAAVVRQIAMAQRRVRNELTRLRRRLLTGTLTSAGALAALSLVLAQEATRAWRRARAGTTLAQVDQSELGQIELESQRDLTALLLLGAGFGFAGFLVLLVSAEAILLDAAVRVWLLSRFARIEGDYYALSQAGEQSAFGTGVPAPPLDDVGTLPGAGVPPPPATPLEQRVIVHWVLGEAEHCIDCVRLSGMSPYFLAALANLGIHPGSGHTRCNQNCRCHLEYEVPIYV